MRSQALPEVKPEKASPESAIEFTGERVIPGRVDPDLLNEHLARYRFAAQFAAGAKVLDAGCGTGYGTAMLAGALSAVGVDLSGEAIAHAVSAYTSPGVRFLQASCESLPFADNSFDLITAFEVIEHLRRWQDLLDEARRVLRPGGILLVSTPNKAWYAEARGAAGPNPWHVREFEYGEFKAALEAVFTHVHLWTQNHSGAIAFTPPEPSLGIFDASGDTAQDQAHFFLAACSQSAIPEPRAFAWAPVSGNLLRERGRHIALLQSEIDQKNAWLEQQQEDQAILQKKHEILLAELRRSNEWAEHLDSELEIARASVARIQNELESTHAGYRARLTDLDVELKSTHAGYQARAQALEAELESTHAGYATRIRELEAELAAAHAGYGEQIERLEADAAARLAWVRDLDAQLTQGRAEIEKLEMDAAARLGWVRDLEAQIARGRAEIARLEKENVDRVNWAQSLDAALVDTREQAARLNNRLQIIERSVWFRIGRKLHLIPDGPRE
jgi:SAM-dependent methyltransferase